MRGLLWFLSAVLLLGSPNGGKASVDRMNYEELHENIRGIVNKAIMQANNNYGKKHIDFHSILADDNSKQTVQVLLTSTPCDKADGVHRKDCEVSLDKRPLVSCFACGDEMNCARLAEQEKIQTYKENCVRYVPGSGHILALKGATENEQDFGCLGCI